MDGGTLIGALDRIEAALGRLESSAERLDRRPEEPAADAELAQRHQALRHSVERALARIDALIAEPPA